MAQIIDGKACSELLLGQIRRETEIFEKNHGRKPGLAVIQVGEDPASSIYVNNKGKRCGEVGMRSAIIRLSESITTEELIDRIARLNQDPGWDGILVQLPLPDHIDKTAVLTAISPEKDVDGFHVLNAGRLFTGEKSMIPCTPRGIMELIRSTGVSLTGKNAVVIGRSNIVGKPMAMLLLNENCTVTVCHSRTRDLARFTKEADILVAAVGKPCFVKADMVKPGAIVIDVGINRVDGKLYGDVDFEAVRNVAGYITPVPGGVGPMTIAELLANTLEAAKNHV